MKLPTNLRAHPDSIIDTGSFPRIHEEKQPKLPDFYVHSKEERTLLCITVIQSNIFKSKMQGLTDRQKHDEASEIWDSVVVFPSVPEGELYQKNVKDQMEPPQFLDYLVNFLDKIINAVVPNLPPGSSV